MNTKRARPQGPLTHIQVLDIATMGAAPFIATLLADFGAEVIKVEQPGVGDSLRQIPPFDGDQPLWWLVLARNKKSITLNLRHPDGQRLLKRLVTDADVLIENFRPGTLEAWNLGPTDLHSLNPGLVIARVTGYGQTGPYRDRAGYGRVAEAMSGLTYITGYPDRPPVKTGIALADYLTALFGAYATMMALYYRDTHPSGKGQTIDLALYEAPFRLLESVVVEFDRLGIIRERAGNQFPGMVPSETYEAKDGSWVTLNAVGDNVFARLATLMGKPELAVDPRYKTNPARVARQDEINAIFEGWVKQVDASEAVKRLNDAGVPAGLIYSIKDAMEDPHFKTREMIIEIDHPTLGALRMPGIVPKLSKTPGEVRTAGPALGEHNREIYQDRLGIPADEVDHLRAAGVI